MNGLGAYGGAMVIYLKKVGKPVVIDFTTRAPLAAQEKMYEVVPGRAGGGMGWWETKNNEQRDGYKAIAIPCGVAGLVTALEKYGTMPLKQVLQPAIRYAEQGFPISDWYASQIASAYPRFKNFPETARIFTRPDGSPLKGGDRLVQKDLAKSLRILADKGPDAFYQGELAQKILADIQKNGGIITARDFADWRNRMVRIQEPATDNLPRIHGGNIAHMHRRGKSASYPQHSRRLQFGGNRATLCKERAPDAGSNETRFRRPFGLRHRS